MINIYELFGWYLSNSQVTFDKLTKEIQQNLKKEIQQNLENFIFKKE